MIVLHRPCCASGPAASAVMLLALLLGGCTQAEPGTTEAALTAPSAETPTDVTSETASLAAVYRVTITKADMEAAPPDLTTPESLATLPWIVTLTLGEDASATVHTRWTGGEEVDDEGTYAVSGNTLTISWSGAGNESSYRFVLADDRLTLEGDPVTMPADEMFAFTSQPWERIE